MILLITMAPTPRPTAPRRLSICHRRTPRRLSICHSRRNRRSRSERHRWFWNSCVIFFLCMSEWFNIANSTCFVFIYLGILVCQPRDSNSVDSDVEQQYSVLQVSGDVHSSSLPRAIFIFEEPMQNSNTRCCSRLPQRLEVLLLHRTGGNPGAVQLWFPRLGL